MTNATIAVDVTPMLQAAEEFQATGDLVRFTEVLGASYEDLLAAQKVVNAGIRRVRDEVLLLTDVTGEESLRMGAFNAKVVEGRPYRKANLPALEEAGLLEEFTQWTKTPEPTVRFTKARDAS